jgi:hypothetical protein
MTAELVHAHCTRPDPAPLACLLPSPTISHLSSNRHDHKMALEEALEIFEMLVPIAKAVPILGAPVEGSLEALSKILKFAQVRHLSTDLVSLYLVEFRHRWSNRTKRRRPSSLFKLLAG